MLDRQSQPILQHRLQSTHLRQPKLLLQHLSRLLHQVEATVAEAVGVAVVVAVVVVEGVEVEGQHLEYEAT